MLAGPYMGRCMGGARYGACVGGVGDVWWGLDIGKDNSWGGGERLAHVWCIFPPILTTYHLAMWT